MTYIASIFVNFTDNSRVKNGDKSANVSTHRFIKFPPNFRDVGSRIWLQLGEIQAKIEHIKRLPIPPDDSYKLRGMYLTKGVHSTTAIEGNSFSEEEVAKIINKEMEAPPSRAYQEKQIDNMVEAFSMVGENLVDGESSRFSVELLHKYHELVLKGLEESISEDVVIGKFRSHRVIVGRYLAAPPDEVPSLMQQYCDWLNEKPIAAQGYKVAEQIVKAIVAHVYFTWIHPYGDGNGRMSRLVEFAILVGAGVPDIAAHLLSNFYNDTRDMYYRELQRSHGESQDGAYPEEVSLNGFLEYALQGYKDELDKQFMLIHALQIETIWHDVIHAEFRKRYAENLTRTQQRRKRLVLDLTDHRFEDPVRKGDIPDITAALARAYRDKTERTIQRDLNALVDMGLLKKDENGYKPNTDILMVFFARSRETE